MLIRRLGRDDCCALGWTGLAWLKVVAGLLLGMALGRCISMGSAFVVLVIHHT